MSFKKITLAIFIILILSIAGLFFAIPFLAAQDRNVLIGVLAGAGLVLAGILSLVVSSIGKSEAGKPVKAKETAAPAPERPAFDVKAVQVLAMLQKKGRLIDFLQEDISAYEDSRIGAAVRNIHKGCLEAIKEHIHIEPVMKEPEGSDITVEPGFDPSSIRLTGKVVGPPPFKGVLRHNGWRVSSTAIPALPENQDLSIIEPAEVEIV